MSAYKYSCQNHEDRKARSSKTLLCSYCYKKKLLETQGVENIFQRPDVIEKNKMATIERNKNPKYRKKQGILIAKALESVDRKGENNSFYGKTHSKETIEKMRLDKLGKKQLRCCCSICTKEISVNNLTNHINAFHLKE